MKDIYRIGVPLPNNPLRELNCYVILGEERNLLIDTGFRRPECLDALKEGLNTLGVKMENTDVVLTHLHSDHTGLISDIVAPESRVFMSDADKDWIHGSTRFRLEKEEDYQFVMAGIPADMIEIVSATHPGRVYAPDPNFDRYESISEGDTFDIGKYHLQVVLTPGHTPSNLCLWMEEQQTMFTGDHVLFDITPNITCWPNLEDSLGHYLDSLRRVSVYDVKLALPAHRETGDFHARVKELLDHHVFRLNECLEVVREEPGLTPFDIAGRMTWRIRAKNWEEFPINQKWFAVGECLSHLERLTIEGRTRQEIQDGLLRYYPIN